MKVVMLKNGAFATNPQTVVNFAAGTEFSLGDRGLTGTNLSRMVELELANFLEGASEEGAAIEIAAKEMAIEGGVEPDAYEFESYTDKGELAVYALEAYGIELDKSKSVKKMIAALKEAIESEGDK